MSDKSPIEWTDATWNPLLGCDKCSAGCVRCYAIRTAWRLQHNPNPTVAASYDGLVEQRPDGSLNWTGKINLLPERLQEPMGWKKPRRIFVNSQSDLFHDDVPEYFIDQVFAAMACCPQHTFQVLTKRAERMFEYLSDPDRLQKIYAQWSAVSGTSAEAHGWPLPNVHIGISVEDQKAADARLPFLVNTPAVIRFLSCEPLLGFINLYGALKTCWRIPGKYSDWREAPYSEVTWHRQALVLQGWKPGVDWVIAGGESGPGARPMHPDWARCLRDQCVAVSIPFLFKQWGEWFPTFCDAGCPQVTVKEGFTFPTGQHMWRVGKKAAGRRLDGREWNEMPALGKEAAVC